MSEVLDYCPDCAVLARCCTDCWNCRVIHCACGAGPALDNPVFDEVDDVCVLEKAERLKEITLR